MIGDLNLFLDWEEGLADINIMIAESEWRGRGIAVECLQYVEELAPSLQITRLSAKI
jgi:GNAT superfamily N-acetyltransferase